MKRRKAAAPSVALIMLIFAMERKMNIWFDFGFDFQNVLVLFQLLKTIF